jgi:hypothetical protein
MPRVLACLNLRVGWGLCAQDAARLALAALHDGEDHKASM